MVGKRGHEASGLGCTATERRTMAVGSYLASASIGNCRSVATADSDDAIKSLICIAFFSFVLILFRDVSPSSLIMEVQDGVSKRGAKRRKA